MARRAVDHELRERIPYRYRIYRADDHALRWILAYGEAQFDADGQNATRYLGTIQDITDQVLAEQALLESEARLRLAIAVADMAVWEVNLDTFEVTGSPQLNLLCGFPADAHPTFGDFRSRYAAGEFDRVQKLGAEAAARGENSIQTVIHQIWPNGTEKWLLLRAQVLPTEGGSGRRVIGVLIDVTERQRAEQRLELVAREMRHRVKNILALTSALARRSFQGAVDGELLDRFSARLGALSVAADLVAGSQDKKTDLRELIETVLAPHLVEGRTPFSLTGPAVTIGPEIASRLAMAIHELATNATKYGALSTERGFVSIEWANDNATLRLAWQEHNGPVVEPPAKNGFGSLLLTRSLFPAPNISELVLDPAGARYNLAITS
jgi:PAS domain S-box-containing protein